MIDLILPSNVVAHEAFSDPKEPSTLFPQEAATIVKARGPRRDEFATARYCARMALFADGAHIHALVAAQGGHGPRWPSGHVGSITHCSGYRAAAVGRESAYSAIGIDAEPHLALPAEVSECVLRDDERVALAALPSGNHWDRIVFSAKEAIFKAWNPTTRRWLDFHDASVRISPDDGRFEADLVPHVVRGLAVPRRVVGRWTVTEGLIGAAVVLPRHEWKALPASA